VAVESTKNLLPEDLFDPVLLVSMIDNIKGSIGNIFTVHYHSHSNFKKGRGQKIH
jgi:hypothetical protein